MSYLFDTQLLVWVLKEPERIPEACARMMEVGAPGRCFSVASTWEVAIKSARRRPGFNLDPRLFRETFRRAQFSELAVQGEHALAVQRLPPIHGDPFDRMLVAQALSEGMVLVTVDKALASYPAKVLLV